MPLHAIPYKINDCFFCSDNFSKFGMSTSVVNEEAFSFSKRSLEQNPAVLHVIVISHDTKYRNDMINSLAENLMEKNHSNNDIWLVGVNAAEGAENTIKG